MKTCPAPPAPGFFDVELRVQWLLAKGNPLSRLEAVLDWELFRPLLDAALAKPAKGPGGRPPHDRLKMFKTLVVQRFYNLSDEQTEYQVSDRLSFQPAQPARRKCGDPERRDADGVHGTARQATAKRRGRALDQEERGSPLRLQEPRQGGRAEQTHRAIYRDRRQCA